MDSTVRDDTRRREPLHIPTRLTTPLIMVLAEITILPRHPRNRFGWLWQKAHHRYMHRQNIHYFNALLQNFRGTIPSLPLLSPRPTDANFSSIIPGTRSGLHNPSSLTVLQKSPLHPHINQSSRKPTQILPRLTLLILDTEDRTQGAAPDIFGLWTEYGVPKGGSGHGEQTCWVCLFVG